MWYKAGLPKVGIVRRLCEEKGAYKTKLEENRALIFLTLQIKIFRGPMTTLILSWSDRSVEDQQLRNKAWRHFSTNPTYLILNGRYSGCITQDCYCRGIKFLSITLTTKVIGNFVKNNILKNFNLKKILIFEWFIWSIFSQELTYRLYSIWEDFVNKMFTHEDGLVCIRKYEPDDHNTVRSLFCNGIRGNIWPAFKSNWNGDKAGDMRMISGPDSGLRFS